MARVGASGRLGYFATRVRKMALIVARSSGLPRMASATSFTTATLFCASSPASASQDASFSTLTSLFCSTSHSCCNLSAAAGCTYLARGFRLWNSSTRTPHWTCSRA